MKVEARAQATMTAGSAGRMGGLGELETCIDRSQGSCLFLSGAFEKRNNNGVILQSFLGFPGKIR